MTINFDLHWPTIPCHGTRIGLPDEWREKPGTINGAGSKSSSDTHPVSENRSKCSTRLAGGEDVVVGATQPQSSPEVERILEKLEVIPALKVNGQDVIDVSGIEKRNPQVIIVDGLAYDNPPGPRNQRRCDEVEALLAAGISVITSINLHFIGEFQDEVALITGTKAPQSVPRKFLEQADEIVDHGPGPQPDGLMNDLSLVVQLEEIDSLLEMSLNDAVPILDDLELGNNPGQVSPGTLDTPNNAVNAVDALGARNGFGQHGAVESDIGRHRQLSTRTLAAGIWVWRRRLSFVQLPRAGGDDQRRSWPLA